jgi:glycosyltransferase involved in cell wall biosynthesis
VEEGCGIKVDASNCNSAVEGMASALLRLLGDDRRRKNMGERARSTVVEHYDWKAKVEVISEQYRILMD